MVPSGLALNVGALARRSKAGGPGLLPPPVVVLGLAVMNRTPPRITIAYCTQCNWLLRAAWMAQELLQTFGQSLGEVALVPGTGGIFEIRVDGTLVWERKADGGFPGPKELKTRIRDIIEPDRDLGHLDRS